MLDMLKDLAMKQLADKMGPNSLGQNETQEAAQEGSNALMDLIQSQIASGGLSKVTELFSNQGASTENNGIFQELQGKMQGILQNKGMDAEAAQQEASGILPGIINTMKDKFMSQDEADSGFDISQIANLAGGDAGDLLNKVKGFF